ncbi:MAG: hypothetical protein EHM45_00715 [Desulfobacteraceae bacterium]|nr:MAG: hypothetical protein EHM45_00715 [Desulfobacteraceae bacterium]
MEYLSLEEIQERKEAVTRGLEYLLGLKALTGKPGARQWQFFRACLTRLLEPARKTDYDDCAAVTAAQYKFEVEDSLRRFYLRPGMPVPYVFALIHKSKLPEYGFFAGEDYPDVCGYCLLIRDFSENDRSEHALRETDPRILRPYLEKVVAAAMEAEYQSYTALPDIAMESLQKWFCPDGPALKEVLRVLYQYHKKKWVLTNPLNPSTKRLLNVKVRKIEAEEAVVATTEYWYLLWWDPKQRIYAYPYRETNHQIYILHKTGPEEWQVFDNLKPPPRATAPHRRKNK